MTSRNVATPFPHTFNGEDYNYWSSRFEVWLKAFDLWNIVDKGFIELEDEDTLSDAETKVLVDNRKKDTHALNQINLAIDKGVYEKIRKATTSKQAWEILQKAYKGDEQVKNIQLQILRSEFEKLEMKDNDSVAEYFTKVGSIVNQMASNNEVLDDLRIVQKVLRSLPEKYFSLVTVIEQTRDLKSMTLEDLQGILKAHEVKISLLFPQSQQSGQALKSQVSIRESLGGSKFFITFIDDFTRKVWIKFLKEKSQAFQAFKDFKIEVENYTGLRIKTLRTDHGGEYISNEAEKYFREHGIRHELIAHFTPQQNGVSERKNRTIVESMRCTLKRKKLSNEFWEEAVSCAYYLINRSPTKSLKDCTPHETWYGRKSDIRHLKVFGSVAYSLIPQANRNKFDDKSEKCIFIGYSERSKAYKLYNPKTKKIVISRDVLFDEDASFDDPKGKANEIYIPSYSEQESEEDNSSHSPRNSPSSSTSPQRKIRSVQELLDSSEPIEYDDSLSKHSEGKLVNPTMFRSLVGNLMYLIATRPDITYAVSCDLAGSIDDSKNTSGYVFDLGSGAITLCSKKQSTIALSTTEAEYIIASFAGCHLLCPPRHIPLARWPRTPLEESDSDNQPLSCRPKRRSIGPDPIPKTQAVASESRSAFASIPSPRPPSGTVVPPRSRAGVGRGKNPLVKEEIITEQPFAHAGPATSNALPESSSFPEVPPIPAFQRSCLMLTWRLVPRGRINNYSNNVERGWNFEPVHKLPYREEDYFLLSMYPFWVWYSLARRNLLTFAGQARHQVVSEPITRRFKVMAGGRRRTQNVDESVAPVARERDLRDVEIADLRRQQEGRSVEQYTAEFEHLMLRCDIEEPEEQTIARYLGGLHSEISNIVQLQPYWTFNDVTKLAHKVERQQKVVKTGGNHLHPKGGSSNRGSILPSKPTVPLPSASSKRPSGSEEAKPSKASSRQCFKCHGYGHIAADCPNQRIITLVEEESHYEEADVASLAEEDDVIYADQGELLV
ncbi:hypothetical protein ZIOFF_030829 [Zingiber officinale]|uniref:Gag-pol polyprotein n=1 Tax=Zingiber officinale TaxID=94328 RepID=A0A8J5H9V3_ZINOF|nr:hypothetical protein ZIOFF_030829 [Zingiber officinale]